MALTSSSADRRSSASLVAPWLLFEPGLGVLYFLTILAALELARSSGGVALIWPANAIAAAVLIRRQSVKWFGAGAALSVACVAANMIGAQHAWHVALLMTSVNILEVGLLVWTCRVFYRFPYPDLSVQQACVLTLMFGFAIPGLTGAVGGVVAHFGMQAPYFRGSLQWWLSDAVGTCFFGPPILLFSRQAVARLLKPAFAAQNLALLVGCTAACGMAIRYVKFPFIVAEIPLLIGAFRVGGFGAAVLSLCVGLLFIALWIVGIRPFGLEAAQHASLLVGLPIVALLATVLPPIAVGLGTDARRAAARALRFSERRFRESMDHSPIGIVIADLDGKWTYTNVALQRMLGFTHEELCEFPRGGPSHPQDMSDISARWRKIKSREVDSYQVERRFMHKSGEWVWAHAAVSMIRDEDGSPRHFVTQIESLQARRSAEDKLAQERERLRITLLAIGDAVITTDADGRITFINASAEALLGTTSSTTESQLVNDVVRLTEAQGTRTATDLVSQSIALGSVQRRASPCLLHRPDGSMSYVADVVSPVMDSNSVVTGTVMVLRDVSADFERAQVLTHRASHDALTGLFNRSEFEMRLKEVLQRSNSQETTSAILAIDLDCFKAVNDSGGHAAGDAVLRRVAEVCRMSVRQSDTVARLGGDEFAVILENCSEARAVAIGQLLIRRLNPLEIEWAGLQHRTGASVGISLSGLRFDTEAEWLKAADHACYHAKREGRGTLRVAAAV